MKDSAYVGPNCQGAALRDRMGDLGICDPERADFDLLAVIDDRYRYFPVSAVDEFACQNRRGKRRCVYRTLQPVPKVRHRSQVIFVRMGQD